MPTYDITFAIDNEPNDSDAGSLLQLNITTAVQACLTTANALWDGNSAETAALDLAKILYSHGANASHVVPDLITMADIADRTNVSKSAVTKWVNESHAHAFPIPFGQTGHSMLWLWQPVKEWVRANSTERTHAKIIDDWQSLNRDEIRRIDTMLAENIHHQLSDIHPGGGQDLSPRPAAHHRGSCK